MGKDSPIRGFQGITSGHLRPCAAYADLVPLGADEAEHAKADRAGPLFALAGPEC
jgi:hypothetical protein